MKHILLYESWNSLNEDGGTHSSGCAMLYLKCSFEDLHSKIDESDIYTEEGDRSFGLENEPHVTLLYGLEDDKVNPEEIMKICLSHEYPDIILHNPSLFENDKYDVLKFDVKCDVLEKVNKDLTALPYKNDYPDYHPHATVAYLKAGTGKKYVEKFKGTEMQVAPDKIVYSRPSGDKIENSDIRYIEKENSNQ